jgi:hypothetical protein
MDQSKTITTGNEALDQWPHQFRTAKFLLHQNYHYTTTRSFVSKEFRQIILLVALPFFPQKTSKAPKRTLFPPPLRKAKGPGSFQTPRP